MVGKRLTSLVALLAGSLVITVTAQATDDWQVELSLESVALLEWEQIDDAFLYHVMHDDEKLGRALGGSAYFALDDAIDVDDLDIASYSFQGEPTGETELTGVEQHERLVVRWNQDAMTKPFIGFRAERVRGNRTSRSRSVAELTNHPRVIAQEPDDIKILLFGDAVEREDRRGLGAPFGFEDDQVVEYGPYIELERP